MHRFFEEMENSLEPGDIFSIDGENHVHLSKSLRMRTGENLVVCDGRGTDYIGELVEVTKTQSQVRILEKQPNTQEPPVPVTLYQGMPKGQKMDLIVQKSVELGAAAVIPVYTSRSVPKESDKGKKLDRWNKIALEAAKQSGRGKVPTVEKALEWEKLLLAVEKHDLVMVAYEERQDSSLKKILQKEVLPESAAIIIGPEGGFDVEEITALEERGVQVIGLGSRILRTETAGLAMLSMMLYEWELSHGGIE